MSALTLADRHELDQIAVPVEDGQLLMSGVAGDGPGRWRTVWLGEGGVRKEPYGPAYTDPQRAAQASIYVNERGLRAGVR